MPSELRLKRIADRIKQELSEMLVTGQISDPRLMNLFITDVTVDREFSAAKIYVSALGGQGEKEEIMDGLTHANGFLRSTLSRKIQLRTFPELRFIWDDTPENAERIERLLDSLSETSRETDDNAL
jgi:ribosome-binding factor A